ncbi:putative internal virion protein [uncultured Mediterranean phage uvMED]|nr:putative internal virion protein [uncultured Mediterranean phage uvMED]BAQ87754.1 putative internal virion protein [uncultured Mediterranean phage uvMED]
MGVFYPQPISLNDIERKKAENNKIVDYSVTDWWDGFKEENLPMLLYQKMNDDSDFPAEENYNPSQDPQLRGYEDFMHHFYFSKSQAETTALVNKMKAGHSINKESPWYHLGRITGAFADPSMLLLLPKVPQVLRSAKVFGTAATAEEFAKQNLDPFRDDKYVAWVAGAAYGIPYILNKLTAPPNIKIQKNVKELENTWIGKEVKDGDVGVDGTFVNPNEKPLSPSTVGAAETATVKPRLSIKQEMTGEKFIKSNLGIFGEDGPWTPVFRVINQKTSLTARKIMGDLLDTPLLKLKNTKAWGFSATGKSIETDMRMMRVGEIESHKLVKDQYLKYVQRQQKETGADVPTTDFFMMFKNRSKKRQSEGWLNQDQFSREVTIARLNSFDHAIPEVAEAARHTQKKVYEPLFALANELKIREIPVQSELNFWTQQLKNLRKKKEGSVTFKSKYGDPDEVYSISRIESTIDKLTQRLKNIKEGGGVKDYINIVYIKNAIDKNKDHFRGIIERFYARKGVPINKAKLNELVEDLSNHFPFIKPRKGDYDVNQRYVFKDPRYARANRSRELNLDKQAQLELIDAGMIMSDIFALQKIYSRQMIPDILLTRKYGDPNGLGYRFIDDGEMSGFNPGLMSVSNEFNLKMANIKVGPKGNFKKFIGKDLEKHLKELKTKRKAELLKERDQVLGDLEAGIELIKGTYGLPANPHAWTSVAMRTMKHYNALTMLTGFMAAIPDIARITMTSGVKRGFRTQFEMFGDFLNDGKLFKMGKKEAQSFGEAVDMVTGQRAMLFADVGDMFGLANKFEGGMGKLSAVNFMYINLMSRWTEMAKSMASVTIGSRILEDSIAWGKGGLKDKWKTALSSSGIDKDMARRIANQFNEHGTKTKSNFMANTSQWTDKQAVDAFGAALNKDINITIVTPGLGDTPKWMSKELGSTIAQFKKFAMSATQRMLMRGMQERDLDFLFGSMMLMGSGMLIDGIYHKYRFNRDYSKLSLTQKLLNAFDRSGLAGIYTDVNKAIETLTDNRFGIAPMLGEKKPYGSSTRWKMGTIFGASGGQIYNIFDIMFDVGGNKYNHHTAKNVRRLIPFQNVWYLDWLFDDIQKGLRFK